MIIDILTKFLTFVHVLGVVEGEGDGEAAEEEDGGCDAAHHHTLPAVARALCVRADETGGKSCFEENIISGQ